MLVAALELSEGVFVVAEVYHQHVELHVDVQVFLGQSEEGCNTVHVAYNTVGVGRTFHQ